MEKAYALCLKAHTVLCALAAPNAAAHLHGQDKPANLQMPQSAAGVQAPEQAVRRLPLSAEASCLGLGHFLELSLVPFHVALHGAPLHSGCARYFGMGSTLFCFNQVCTSIHRQPCCAFNRLPAEASSGCTLSWLQRKPAAQTAHALALPVYQPTHRLTPMPCRSPYKG